MKTYDPKNVTVTFNSTLVDGFGPDTIIKATRNQDGWTYQPSNSGRGARSRNPDKSGRIEITLGNHSAANALLWAIAEADELTGEGVGEVLIKDRSTSTAQVQAENAWIMKLPDWERAKEAGVTTWILETDELNITHDGLIDS